WTRRDSSIIFWIVSVIEDWVDERIEFFCEMGGTLVSGIIAGGIYAIREEYDSFATLNEIEVLPHDFIHCVVEMRAQSATCGLDRLTNFLPVTGCLVLYCQASRKRHDHHLIVRTKLINKSDCGIFNLAQL